MTAAAVQASIPVRFMDFEFTPDIPENWGVEANPMMTALMGALSASFPAGERYFIQSVAHYMKDIQDDPELLARVRGFSGQEGQHTKEHLAFNRFLEDRGIPVLAIEKRVEEVLKHFTDTNTPAHNLARTVALEHLTAFLAAVALDNDEVFFGKMHPTIAAFWGWHLIEEFEHRSVAFDVYQKCVGDDKLRKKTMVVTTILFSVINLVRTARIMRITGHGRNFRAWREGYDIMFGKLGVFRKMMPLYMSFYKDGFHPDDYQVQDELDEARARFLTKMRVKKTNYA